MSSLPNSKSSFLRAAQGCGALVLAGAMVLPMTPALAQDAAPVADAPAANAVPPPPSRLLRTQRHSRRTLLIMTVFCTPARAAP